MPVEDAAQRGAYGEERYEKVDFQMKVSSESPRTASTPQ